MRRLPAPIRQAGRTALAGPRLRRLVGETWLDPDFARRVDLPGRLRRLQASVAEARARSGDGSVQSYISSPYTAAGIERYGRLAAAAGVEPRHPFLDLDLVDFAPWVPSRLLQRQGYPKWALREAMAGLLPERVAWRRGQEHLGPAFNQGLLAVLRTGEPVPAADRLLPFLQRAALPPWPADRPASGPGPDWEVELRLRNLERWLHEWDSRPT